MNKAMVARKIRALGLCSGGLDSILSALILERQGLEVGWVSFETPFFSADSARRASRNTGIPLRVVDITDAYLEMMKSPRAGFGKNMNPCMDCHALMFRTAAGIMADNGFDFLFSGEVAGQRPFSQNTRSLRYVEKQSGMDGFILRPLSARILPETPMEANGLVDRERLYGISGRSRKEQIKMAAEFGVTDYPSPAGGCLLTDKIFSRRLKDLMDAETGFSKSDLHLLKFGRHFRFDSRTRVIVGRSRSDNEGLMAHLDPDHDLTLKHTSLPGPLMVIPGGGSADQIERAAALCAGYTKAAPGDSAEVRIRCRGRERILSVTAASPEAFRELMI